MKNTRKMAQVLAILLAAMMIIGVIIFAMPNVFAEDGEKTELTEEEKKRREEEDYWRAVEADRQYRVEQLQNQILSMIDQFKGKPGYYGAVQKLEKFLDSVNPRDILDPRDYEAAIAAFKKDDSELQSKPLLKGDEKNNFNPDNNLTRAEFAMILARMDNQIFLGTGENWYQEAMNHAKTRGYLKGDDSGDMMPMKNISLAEVVTVFVRYKGYTKMEGNMSKVPEDHWAKGEMQRAYMDGWISGIENISDCDRPITRGELASILTKVRQIKIDKQKMDEQIGLYKRFFDVNKGNRYYYDILVNTK